MRLLLFLLLLLGGVSSETSTTIQSTSSTPVDTGSTNTGSPVATDQTNPSTTQSSTAGSSGSTAGSSGSTAGSSTATGTTLVVTTIPVVTTTLPPVNVSVVQFSNGTCSKGFCSYTYIAPMNDPNVLNTEQSYIADDQLVYKNASDHVNAFQSNVAGVTDDATAKVAALRTELNNTQIQIDLMQQQLALIINITNMATSNVASASFFLDKNVNPTQECYWNCQKPSPTTTPTPTSTAPPTTTLGPCESGSFTCPLTSGSSSTTPASSHDVCEYRNGKPYCTNCNGNMDGYQQCTASRCDSLGYNVTLGDNWSPGYNGSTTDMTAVSLPAGKICVWNYPTPYNFTKESGAFNFTTIGLPGDGVQLYITPNNIDQAGTYPLNYLTTNVVKINNWLTKYSVKNYTITLTTPETVSPGTYFFFSTCSGASCT